MSARILVIVCSLSAVLCAPPPKASILSPHDDAVPVEHVEQPHVTGTMTDPYRSKHGNTNDIQSTTREELSTDAGKSESGYEEELQLHLEKFLEAYYEMYVSASISKAEKYTKSAKDVDAGMQSDQPSNEYMGFKRINVVPLYHNLTKTTIFSEDLATPQGTNFTDAKFIKAMRER